MCNSYLSVITDVKLENVIAINRAVKPSELVGRMWTKADKNELAPNVLQLIKHSTTVFLNYSYFNQQLLMK